LAILKHISVHNSNYSAAVLYFMYQHDNHARPIYDEHGLMIERENLLIDGINTTPYEYSCECKDISLCTGDFVPCPTPPEMWLQP
jgi:hypothetical protein